MTSLFWRAGFSELGLHHGAHLVADRDRALDRGIKRKASDIPLAFLLDAEVRLHFGMVENCLSTDLDAVPLAELREDVRQFVPLDSRDRLLTGTEWDLDSAGHAAERYTDETGIAVQGVRRIPLPS
jgi:hypothetical protein